MRFSIGSWVQTYRMLVDLEFADLRAFVLALENFLGEEMQRLKKYSDETASKMTEEERRDFYDSVSDEYYQFGETFPKILRYSLFTHAYSHLEHILLQIANHLRQSQNLDLSPNDLREEGILRAKTYLKKVARITFPDGGTTWQDILALNSVRNLIIHNNGYFPEDYKMKNQIDALIVKWANDFSLDKDRYFALSESFIEHVIQTYENFLNELFTNIKEPS